jgi:hypothetical protein
MRPLRNALWTVGWLGVAFAFISCGHKDEDHDHNPDPAHSHSAEEQAASGATFETGKGLLLAEATRQSLNVQVAKVIQQRLPAQLRFNVQIFRENHHHPVQDQDHTGCDVHGSGFLPSATVASVRVGLPVQILTASNTVFHGWVLDMSKAMALGETELIIGVTNGAGQLKPGEFLAAVLTLPTEEGVNVIPRSALLRTAEGTFVYVATNSSYRRTSVEVSGETDDLVGIAQGLRAGDSVVSGPVETLWLIELRLTKGGGHSH